MSICLNRQAFCFQLREIIPKIWSASRPGTEIRNGVDDQVDPQAQVQARLIQAKYNYLEPSSDFIIIPALGQAKKQAEVYSGLVQLRRGGGHLISPDFRC